MRKPYLGITLGALACSTLLPASLSAGTFDPYITASVSLTARPALSRGDQDSDPSVLVDVQSAGNAEIRTWQGEIMFNALLIGDHWIHKSGNPLDVVVSKHFETLGQYSSGEPREQAEPGQCYQARLYAQSQGIQAERGSSEICAEDSCPLIVDLDSDGFHLVGAERGIHFDLDADGEKELLGWTAGGELDGFLCFDRNGNGVIDDGTELFGGSTPFLDGARSPNGFAALSLLDHPENGGNGDERIDQEDRNFQELCIWFDLNHDGISQAHEIAPLVDTGILSLEYSYVEKWRRDRFGNLFRFMSKAVHSTSAQGSRPLIVYDVYFERRSQP